MLDQKVSGANLALGDGGGRAGTGASTVVSRHIVFELFGIGAGRGFPSRYLLYRIEVVGEIFRVGVAHLPVEGKTRFGLEGGDGSQQALRRRR